MKKLTTLVLAFLAMSCSTTYDVMVHESEETEVFNPRKMVIIGVTNNFVVRDIFEEKMRDKLVEYNINAYKNNEVDPMMFTKLKTTKKDLNRLITAISNKGFDSFMITALAKIEEVKVEHEIYYMQHIKTNIYVLENEELKVFWSKRIDIFDYYDVGVDEFINAIVTGMKADSLIPKDIFEENLFIPTAWW